MQSSTQGAIAPRLIAIPEVSTITSLRKTALYELIKARELRPVKIGKKLLFVESEVHAWVNQRLASRGSLTTANQQMQLPRLDDKVAKVVAQILRKLPLILDAVLKLIRLFELANHLFNQ